MLDRHPGSVKTFLRNIRRRPRATGAIFPSGSVLAKAMVQHIDPMREGMTIELGPGTGVFTKALLDHGVKPENLLLIEYNADFVRYLRRRFKGVTVVHGSAFDLAQICMERGLTNLNGVVSGLPLLNFDPADCRSLLSDCMRLLARDARLSQFTYSQLPSIKAYDGVTVSLCKRVWLNLPPATVWLYTPDRTVSTAAAETAASGEEDITSQQKQMPQNTYAGAA